MPLKAIPHDMARDNQRNNPFARWPDRSLADNRIEPIAKPSFKASFRFTAGSTIFTIGSCFARNVETALLERGFDIPTREFWSDDKTGRATDNWILDNYGAPSIYNEFAWALGEQVYNPEEQLIEAVPGKFADQHLPVRVPLCSWDEAIARRQRIFHLTRSFLRADAIIMTLGMAEVWFDTLTKSYLNVRPRGTMASAAERYELHILDYNDVVFFLQRTLDLIFSRRPDTKLILSVSPVPMSATYSGDDVAVANGYSKAVLRAAASAIALQNDRVDYFPSYESVTLSDRASAWESDLVHVRPELIEMNVSRMIAAYVDCTSESVGTENKRHELDVDERKIARATLDEAEHYFQIKDFALALEKSQPLFSGDFKVRALTIAARSLLALKQPHEAEALLRAGLANKYNVPGWHGYLGKALMAQGRVEDAAKSFETACAYAPEADHWLAEQIKAMIEAGKTLEVGPLLEKAMEAAPDNRTLRAISASLARDQQGAED